MTDTQDTNRLDRAIDAARAFAFDGEAPPLSIFEREKLRSWCRALIADILQPDPKERGADTITMGSSFCYGARTENYTIRKRACLLTPEELAQEAEWEQSP